MCSKSVHNLTIKLRGRWPAAFSDPPQPLQIGIGALIAEALYKREWELMGYSLFTHTRRGQTLSDALHIWTRSPLYLKACTRGAARVNLNGESVGEVSEAQAVFAAMELQRQANIRRAALKLV